MVFACCNCIQQPVRFKLARIAPIGPFIPLAKSNHFTAMPRGDGETMPEWIDNSSNRLEALQQTPARARSAAKLKDAGALEPKLAEQNVPGIDDGPMHHYARGENRGRQTR